VAAHVFEKYNPTALFVTCAERGSLVVTADGMAECPPVDVDCVSGVGAGDAYVAGLLHCLYNEHRPVSELSLEDWLQAGMTGNFVGAMSTRAIDANSAIPTRAELEAWRR
jgi:sugar/nucleoside kinase (ribokinase family)